MPASTTQLEQLTARGLVASEALSRATRAAGLRRGLVCHPFRALTWWAADDYDGMRRGERRTCWWARYRLRLWRLEDGAGWRWQLEAMTGTVLRFGELPRKRDARAAALGALESWVTSEIRQLEQEAA